MGSPHAKSVKDFDVPLPPGIRLGRIAAPGTDLLRIAPLAILAYSFLIFPPELRLTVGSLAFPLYRIVIVGFLFALFTRLVRTGLRFTPADALVLGASAWMVISFMTVYPLSEALVRGGGLVIDMAGSYFLARLSIRSITDVRRWLVIVAPGLFFAGSIVFLESVTRTIFWRPFFIDLFGPLPIYSSGEEIGKLGTKTEMRLGLARGYGPFSHQILAGSVLVSALPFYFKSGLRSWPRWTGIQAALFGFFSLSSAAILGLLTAIGLLVADWGKRLIRGLPWQAIAAGVTMALFAVHLLSQNGLVHLLSRMTLNPQTAFYRQIIWRYGWQSMLDNPLFGIGYQQHERPSWLAPSVDAHFLALAIRNGMPAPLMLLAAIGVVMFAIGRKASRATGLEREFLVGTNIALATLLMLAMTVMFFSEANIWFMLVLGTAASLSVADLRKPSDG